MPKQIREPIQVYLSQDERDKLDDLAARLGVSRSEILRRGIGSLSRDAVDPSLLELTQAGLVRPARIREGRPPPGRPVMPLGTILQDLDTDRADL